MKPIKQLTPKQRSVIEYMITHPEAQKQQIADEFHITKNSVTAYLKDPLFSEALDKRLKEEWKSYAGKAAKRMRELLDSADSNVRFKAAKYLLDSNGFAAPLDINISSNEIKIVVKPEDENKS